MPLTDVGGLVEDLAARLHAKKSNGWYRVAGSCHAGSNPSTAAFRRGDRGGLVVWCFSGCDRPSVLLALSRASGLDLETEIATGSPYSHGRGATPTQLPAPRPAAPDKAPASDTARRIWDAAVPIPYDSRHPARRWMAARHLWRGDVTIPPGVRWLRFRDRPDGGGGIVAALAPLEEWEAAWPAAPDRPRAVHTVFVDGTGQPAFDRPADRGGLRKRSYGPMARSVFLVGQMRGDHDAAVVEGLADALAVAARLPGPVVTQFGTAGHYSGDLLDAVKDAGRVAIWADLDGPGLRAAHTLRSQVGPRACVLGVGRGDDPAAAGGPFAPIDPADLEREAAIEAAAGLPAHEARRISSQLLG